MSWEFRPFFQIVPRLTEPLASQGICSNIPVPYAQFNGKWLQCTKATSLIFQIIGNTIDRPSTDSVGSCTRQSSVHVPPVTVPGIGPKVKPAPSRSAEPRTCRLTGRTVSGAHHWPRCSLTSNRNEPLQRGEVCDLARTNTWGIANNIQNGPGTSIWHRKRFLR